MTRTVTAAFFLLFSVFYLGISLQYPMFAAAGHIGAGFFPAVIAVCLVALSAVNLLSDWHAKRKEQDDQPGLADTVVLTGMVVLYLVLMRMFGTVVPTLAFTLVVLAYFHRGSLVKNLVTAVALTATVYVVFGVVFDAPLPEGAWPLGALP